MKITLENIKRVVILALMFIMSFNLINVHERFYQTGKDICFYSAAIALTVILVLVNGIHIKKPLVIAWFVVCVAFVVAYVLIKNVRPSTYGAVYFKVVILRVALWAAVAFALPIISISRDFIGNVKRLIKAPFFWITAIVFGTVVVLEREYIPFICPLVLLLFIRVNSEKLTEFFDSFSLSYFLAFFVKFTKSLVVKPFEYDTTGRYIGLFLNNSKLGALCGVAIVCVLYFAVRIWWTRKDVKPRVWKLVVLALMFVYASVAFVMVRGRAGELGLVLAVFAMIIFLHGSEKKHTTIIRFGIMFGVAIIILAAGIITANVLQSKIQSGNLKYEDLSYTMAHLAGFADKEESVGLFKAGTLANALDALSAQRLSTWKELGSQIIPVGHIQDVDTATHSTYVYWLVEYGLYPGLAVIVWFLAFIVFAGILATRRERAAIMPILWVCFYAGAFLTSNEYWNAPGGFMLLVFAYPLIRCFKGKTENEIVENR